jgi:hypothetical protein
MLYLAMKAALSGIIIAIVSEVAARRPGLGALILSLPLVSILAIIWLWRDTGDVARIATLAEGTFWLVLPTLPMFLLFPALLRGGVGLAGSPRLLPIDARPLPIRCVVVAAVRDIDLTGCRSPLLPRPQMW